MAQSKFIQSVVKAAKGRPRSTEWFRDKIKEFGKPGAMDLIRDGRRNNRPFFGRLNMFFYDPKFKKTLPYYDTFPLVLPLEKYTDGFLGINFHYLPIPLRVKLLNSLVSGFANNSKLDESTRLNVSYDSVGKRSLVKPTLHKYLKTNLRSQFRRIDADEFTVAALLPVARFKKASASEVYKDSRAMI